MQNTLVLLPLDEEYRKRIMAASQGKSDVVFCDSSWTRDEYISALQCADVLLGDPEPEDLNACQNLRWMQTTWSGVRQYVTCEVFRQGAVLCNMTGAYGPAIAEHEMAMILALCKRLPQYQNHQSRGLWKMAGFDKTLEGSTVLILGAGDIGCELAKRLRPFVKKIIGIRRREREYPDYFDEMITLNDLDQCLPLADVVSCSLPDTLETRHLLDKRRLHLMKKGCDLNQCRARQSDCYGRSSGSAERRNAVGSWVGCHRSGTVAAISFAVEAAEGHDYAACIRQCT